MGLLEKLSVEHPYYCSDCNYYSNDAGSVWETMTEFLDEFEDADIDMNFMFRWDIKNRSETEEGKSAGRYCAEVFLMYQRKGIFAPHIINHVNEAEAERFQKYAQKHWEYMQKIWLPLSQKEQTP